MQMRINIPPLTRILLGVLLTVSTAHQASRWVFVGYVPLEILGIVPSQSIYYPWVYVTASFAEQNIVTLLIGGATLFYGGKYLERAWGSTEFGKFVLIVTVIPNIVTALVYIFWFAITRNVVQAWVLIQGSVAYQGAFLVAFKQLVPEHSVTILKGFVKVRVKHFPAIFLVANTLSGVLFATDTALILAWAGFFVSWIYLRFYKRQADLSGLAASASAAEAGGILSSASGSASGSKGDASETFTFASFWPDVIQPPIARVSDLIYTLAVTARLITPFTAEDIETSTVQASSRGEGGLPSLLNSGGSGGGRRSAKREEAERRRALALKALDQRLQTATAGSASAAARQPPASQATTAATNIANSSSEDARQAAETGSGSAAQGEGAGAS